jgi:hypothetical protein
MRRLGMEGTLLAVWDTFQGREGGTIILGFSFFPTLQSPANDPYVNPTRKQHWSLKITDCKAHPSWYQEERAKSGEEI